VELKLDDTDEERLDSTLEDDEVGDFEDTVLAVEMEMELELVGLTEESAELFELDELEVWEFVEE
jgi:hypothetical protein